LPPPVEVPVLIVVHLTFGRVTTPGSMAVPLPTIVNEAKRRSPSVMVAGAANVVDVWVRALLTVTAVPTVQAIG
jgi:hypothetical protein